MSELTDILHKILSVAEGESAQRVIHDEIDALGAVTENAPAAEPAPADAGDQDPGQAEVPPAAPEAQEAAQPFGSESAPEVADVQ